MYIYETSHNVTKMSYVGQCVKDLEKSQSYFGSGIYLNAAIKKHGKENFTKTILEVLPAGSTQDQLNEREQFWIKERNTIWPNGYNLTFGGEGGVPSAETRKKMSKAQKLRKRTKEELEKFRIAASMPRSEQAKKNISESKKGVRHPLFGKHLTTEYKNKISVALKGVKKSEQAKLNMSKARKGIKFTEEHKKNLRKPKNHKPGYTSWNKGLTKETDERVKRQSEAIRKKAL